MSQTNGHSQINHFFRSINIYTLRIFIAQSLKNNFILFNQIHARSLKRKIDITTITYLAQIIVTIRKIKTRKFTIILALKQFRNVLLRKEIYIPSIIMQKQCIIFVKTNSMSFAERLRYFYPILRIILTLLFSYI